MCWFWLSDIYIIPLIAVNIWFAFGENCFMYIVVEQFLVPASMPSSCAASNTEDVGGKSFLYVFACGTRGAGLWPEVTLAVLGPQNLHPGHKIKSILAEEILRISGAAMLWFQEFQMLGFLGFCQLSNSSLWLSCIPGTPGNLKIKTPSPTQ